MFGVLCCWDFFFFFLGGGGGVPPCEYLQYVTILGSMNESVYYDVTYNVM